jgi:hypothetical protein
MAETLRDEIEQDIRSAVEKQYRLVQERLIRGQARWDREREAIHREDFDAWLEDTAQKLGRPAAMIHLLEIAETYALQRAVNEAWFRWSVGEIPFFGRIIPLSEAAEIERLAAKIADRIPDNPVFVLRHLSGLFGAVQATSNEVFGNAMSWIDRSGREKATFVNETCSDDGMDITANTAQLEDKCCIQLWGPTWGRLLADEISDWTHESAVQQAIRIRTQGHP